MSNLVNEIVLRLAKAGIALVLGVVLYLVADRPARRRRIGRARAPVLARAPPPSSCSWRPASF